MGFWLVCVRKETHIYIEHTNSHNTPWVQPHSPYSVYGYVQAWWKDLSLRWRATTWRSHSELTNKPFRIFANTLNLVNDLSYIVRVRQCWANHSVSIWNVQLAQSSVVNWMAGFHLYPRYIFFSLSLSMMECEPRLSWASCRFGDGSSITAGTGDANWVNRGRIKFSHGHLCDEEEQRRQINLGLCGQLLQYVRNCDVCVRIEYLQQCLQISVCFAVRVWSVVVSVLLCVQVKWLFSWPIVSTADSQTELPEANTSGMLLSLSLSFLFFSVSLSFFSCTEKYKHNKRHKKTVKKVLHDLCLSVCVCIPHQILTTSLFLVLFPPPQSQPFQMNLIPEPCLGSYLHNWLCEKRYMQAETERERENTSGSGSVPSQVNVSSGELLIVPQY